MNTSPVQDAKRRSLFVLIFALSMLACGDGDRQPENQSSNPLYPSGPEQVQRGQIVTVEGSSVAEAEVVIIDAERLVVLARAPVDDQGGFVVSVPQRPSYWLGVSGPYMTTYMDTAFAFTGEAITISEAPRSDAAGKAAQVVGILGDVNNDNQVDIADALLVLLYTLERISFAAPNQGNIALGDVNEDGQIDIADVLLIMTYIANPLDPTLPDGIGLGTDRDRAVLIALYEATGGANWDENTNWLSSTYSLDQWDGVYTDDEGRVTGLDLDRNELTGPIPEVLGQLNSLESLNLRGNQLTGTIPNALAQLASLQTLNLSYNQLTGTIPEALGQLDSLETLHLDNNQLTGCIPSALQAVPNNDFNNLELAFCHLESGEVAVLAALYEATGGDHWTDNTNWLSVAPLNEWYGVTTDDEGRVTSLDLGGNQLTGTIPEVLIQLEKLEFLDLSDNQLTGVIPEALGQLNNLQALYLSGNQATYPPPSGLTKCIPSALQAVPNNDFNNLEIAFCLERSEAVVWFALYEATGGDHWTDNTNWLSVAPLNKWYGVTTDDEGRGIELNLTGNQLTGPIPEALGQLNNLQALYLTGNQLTGVIPEVLGQLNNLRYLYLNHNQLTGPIPEALGQLNNLQALYLTDNQLTGCIPLALRTVPNDDLDDLGLAFCQ